MKLSRVLTIAMVAGTLSAGALHAQIRESQPAEFPPSSFKGKQYVDSKGCVFVRAGIDGNVSWVPRVSRDRKAICGFKPSLAGQVAQAAPAPAPRAAPEQITIEAAPAPAPQPAPVATAQRAPVVVTPRAPVVVRQTAPAPKPRVVKKPVVVAAPKPAPAPVARQTAPAQVASSCPGASALSQQYLRGTRGAPVRCGPQSAPIVGVRGTPTSGVAAPRAAAAGTQALPIHSDVAVSERTRIVPRHVAHNRVNTTNVAVPQGYRKVWDDGRLNPKRAEQNLAGRSDMLLVWTQTVPRRLIDTRSGRDVTASVPLVYPYTDVPTQRAQLGEVSIVKGNGQVRKRIVRNAGAKVRQPVYSSRSAPEAATAKPAAPARAVAGSSYVQIGTYRNPANAQAAAQQVARMGMPARIGKYRKGGQTYMTVQAGPFAGPKATSRAMRTLRNAGYKDAFARK